MAADLLDDAGRDGGDEGVVEGVAVGGEDHAQA
jgi:hypothetical protein